MRVRARLGSEGWARCTVLVQEVSRAVTREALAVPALDRRRGVTQGRAGVRPAGRRWEGAPPGRPQEEKGAVHTLQAWSCRCR